MYNLLTPPPPKLSFCQGLQNKQICFNRKLIQTHQFESHHMRSKNKLKYKIESIPIVQMHQMGRSRGTCHHRHGKYQMKP